MSPETPSRAMFARRGRTLAIPSLWQSLLVVSLSLLPIRSDAVQPPEAGSVAPSARTPDTANPDISVLPDGARLVVIRDPAATETVIDIFFKVGQSDEGRWSGMNALITRSWISEANNRDAMQLQGDIERNGGAVGSESGPDWTELWGACSPDEDSFRRLAETLLANVVSEPLFPEDAVNAGRDEQLRALASRHDRLVMNVMDEMQSRAYGDAPYALPLLGTQDTVVSIPWKQVGAYYRRYFRPDRAVIVVNGRMRVDDVKNRIMASIGGGGWDDVSPLHAPAEQLANVPPIPMGLRSRVVSRHAPAICVAVGFLAPGTDSRSGSVDYATLLVLDAILGGGKASRLFALRDRPASGMAPIGYEIRSILLPGRTQSLWSAYVVGDRPAAEVETELIASLHDLSISSKPLTAPELVHAKTYLKARHLESHERPKDRAYGAGWAETMGLSAAFDTGYDAIIDSVTIDQVSALAIKVFSGRPAAAHSLPIASEER